MAMEVDPIVVLSDLDGTVVDFVGGWKKIWNKKYPDRPITDDPSVFPLEEAYSGIAKEDEILEIMHTPEFFLGLEPMPGAIEALKQMAEIGLHVVICSMPTSRSCSYSEKVDWVEMHLGKEWTKRIVLTKDKTLVHGDYLIDDNPVIKGVYDPTWEHILYDASYNQNDPMDRFRINWKNWPSLLLHHSGDK